MNPKEADNLIRFAEERRRYNGIDQATTNAARALAERLNVEIEKGHEAGAFFIALLIAATKDGLDIILDLFLLGEIPIIGQLPGIYLSVFLTYFLWGKGMFNRTKIKVVYYSLGLVFDNLPLLNDLPMNTLLVLWAWHVVRHRARRAEREFGEINTHADTVNQEA